MQLQGAQSWSLEVRSLHSTLPKAKMLRSLSTITSSSLSVPTLFRLSLAKEVMKLLESPLERTSVVSKLSTS